MAAGTKRLEIIPVQWLSSLAHRNDVIQLGGLSQPVILPALPAKRLIHHYLFPEPSPRGRFIECLRIKPAAPELALRSWCYR